MATTSEVISGLDDIAQAIRTERRALQAAVARVTASVNALNAIPTTFSAVVSTINGFTPTGAFETGSKDQLAKLTTEFTALKAAATSMKTELDAISL